MPKKLPKSMGACADLLYEVREKRLAADKVAAELKVEEERIKSYIIDNMPETDSGGIGKHHKAQVVLKPKARVNPEKWDGFFGWVAKNKRFDLLQKRINDAAVLDTLNQPRAPKIPGVERFTAKTVSLTKV